MVRRRSATPAGREDSTPADRGLDERAMMMRGLDRHARHGVPVTAYALAVSAPLSAPLRTMLLRQAEISDRIIAMAFPYQIYIRRAGEALGR
jgi:hypothetical protein